jgi:hypothetical protein
MAMFYDADNSQIYLALDALHEEIPDLMTFDAEFIDALFAAPQEPNYGFIAGAPGSMIYCVWKQ